MLDAINEIGRNTTLSDNLQVLDALADCDAQLMSVDHAGQGDAGALPPGGFCQQILVPAEEHPVQLTGPLKQCSIIQSRGSVGLRGEHIHTPPYQGSRDHRRHMNVRVEGNAHNLPAARNLWRRGELDTTSASASACWRLCSISRSRSA